MSSFCLNCRHYEHRNFDFWTGAVTKGHVCLAGHDEAMKQWWAANGKKPVDKAEPMPCFEETDGARMLNNMIRLTDRMIDIIDQRKQSNEPTEISPDQG